MSSVEPLDHLLHTWLPRQRWYPAKGRGVSLHQVGGMTLDDPDPTVEVEVHLVGLDSGGRFDVVQVPLTFRSEPLEGAGSALLGRTAHGRFGERWVYDGPHDPAYVAALLRSLDAAPGSRVPDPGSPGRVLSGEQSNTSVIVADGTSDACIVKVFRTLHPGANPDVEVAAALTRVGCSRVARPVGWASGTWSARDGSTVEGHLAVAAEFLEGSQDAWREAVVAVTHGTDFTSSAAGLGGATAQVHVSMAEAFGHLPMSEEVRGQVMAGLRARVAWALASAPALEPHASALRHHTSALDSLGPMPDLQRVHGDYHLGQVLHSPERGWILLDFEGEPLRPLAERVVPDLALRDVAGMLRSFDYAARHAGEGAAEQSQGWAMACREAFCAGYADAGGDDPRVQAELLTALELDKALYEVVYETRNRPDWLDVPLRAVERLLA